LSDSLLQFRNISKKYDNYLFVLMDFLTY